MDMGCAFWKRKIIKLLFKIYIDFYIADRVYTSINIDTIYSFRLDNIKITIWQYHLIKCYVKTLSMLPTWCVANAAHVSHM